MRRIVVGASVLALLALSAMPVAAASPSVSASPNVKGSTQLVYRNSDGTSVVLTALPGTSKKTLAQANPDALAAGWLTTGKGSAALAQPQLAAAAASVPSCSGFRMGISYTCTMAIATNKYMTPPGGSRDRIETSFSSRIRHIGNYTWGMTTDVYYDSSHSWTLWWGTNPYVANEVRLADSWLATGWAFTGVTISIPPGVGFGVSNSTLTWQSPSLPDTDRMEHYTYGVHFSGADLNGTDQTASSDMRFGSSWFTSYSASKGEHT